MIDGNQGKISVREAAAEDLPDLLAMWRVLEGVQSRFRVVPMVDEAEKIIAALIQDALASADARVFIAEADGAPVGMAVANVDEPHPRSLSKIRGIELSRVVVLPEARGRGVGSMLADAAAAFGRERDATHLVAKTFSGNEGARVFWRKAGFTARVETLVRPID